MSEQYDVVVVGGGVNGASIARDAVGRGLSVLLCERDDLASHTSSASSKLIHGGLRYLEQYEFGLVSEALAEREVLLRLAPHISRPLRFVIPHEPHLRPVWMIRAGLFLYDHLGRGKRTLPGSRKIKLRTHPAGQPLNGKLTTGFVYSDAQVKDARLVTLNAMDAHERGATVLTRTACTKAQRNGNSWDIALKAVDGRHWDVKAKALVNATGPWGSDFLDRVVHIEHKHKLRLVKGSHIVVPAWYEHDYAYTFQLDDRRIVFAIPWQEHYTLIGTTDTEYKQDPSTPSADDDEVSYLCAAASQYFKRAITPADVLWSFSGVRPLVEDKESSASEVTRGYRLELDTQGAPLVSVFGGKVTTSRHLAEEVVDKLASHFSDAATAWTAKGAPLPGGDIETMDSLLQQVRAAYPWLPLPHARRWVRSYGTRVWLILDKARSLDELGTHFGADLYQTEVDYLCQHEWVTTSDDILWRRSKLGLKLKPKEVTALADYLATRVSVSEQYTH